MHIPVRNSRQVDGLFAHERAQTDCFFRTYWELESYLATEGFRVNNRGAVQGMT